MGSSTVVSSVLFSRDAGSYDNLRRRLIPCFDDFYGSALELIHKWRKASSIDVLDIGAGTGLFASMVTAQCPVERLCLLDGSDAMLEQARTRFPASSGVEYRLGSMADTDLGAGWDLVISALAIHHLADEEKRDLYRRIHGSLKPGGLFVNAEQVAGPDPVADERYATIWLEQVRRLGVSEEDIDKALERMAFDRCAPVVDQLEWLRDGGFNDVDCSFKSWRFAVISGIKT